MDPHDSVSNDEGGEYYRYYNLVLYTSDRWMQLINQIYPTVHLSHISQCPIKNRNVHISVLNIALWDIGQVHCGICEFGLLR